MTKTKAGPIHADRLKSFIERIEKLIEERTAIQCDIKDVYSEAKGVGYDVATMRKVVALRAMDAADRDEMETLIDTYMHALGDAKRMAVEAMQRGAGTREAARAAGIAVGAASQLRTGVHGIANRERVHESQNDEQSREVDSTSDDAGHRSEPSAPADMGITMSANAGPPLGQSAASLDSQGEQSGTHSGEINEIHRGATQPKGCAKVVRTDASMSESVAASGDAVRDASAMPLDVVAAPHSEGREHAGSAATAPPACVSGTHSGGYAQPVITRDVTTEPGGDAQDETGVGGNVCTDECSGRPTGAPVPESCGEPAAALGAKALARSCGLTTAPLRPHDTPSGGSSTGRTSPFQGEDAGSSPVPRSNNTALDTRGEARPNPDGLDILPFLRRRVA